MHGSDEEASDSSGSNSDVSSQDDSSDVSDLEKFDEAYMGFSALTDGVLSAASKHLKRLLEGYCMEVYVTNTNPDSQLHFVRKFAKDLVVVFAFHLAKTIATLFRHVLNHPNKVLYDPETEPLFLPLFWFYPIYREMLNSASRHRPSNKNAPAHIKSRAKNAKGK